MLALPARLSPWLQRTSAASATTFIVTTNADGGPGSLRQAITDANANAGPDTIRFQISAGSPSITLSSALPAITDPVVIDGTTQPGYAGAPFIEINGSNVSGSVSGLNITAGGSTVRALAINGFRAAAIMLTTNGGNAVEGCYLGLGFNGVPRGNGTGLILNSDHNLIGGTTAASRNVISLNDGDGILSSSPAFDNTIQGNYIGTDVTGSFALPNGVGGNLLTGRGIAGGLRNSLIGGTAPGAGNVISGNRRDGIGISSGNTIQGNYIGTDATGMTGIANGGFGIRLIFSTASNNKIGGVEPGARNVISGNGNGGVSLESGVSGTIVRGNYVGVNADASAPLPNAPDIGIGGFGGIYIKSSSNNIIGGTGAGEGNVIAFSGGAPGFNGGVIVVSASPTFDQEGNSIRGNSIFSNDGLGIDIGQSGVNPNDPGDADAGAGAGQNFPILSSYSSDGTTTTVRGTLASKAGTSYDLDFYSNRGCDPSGNGEGAQYVGSTTVTTDAAGNSTFEATLPTPLPTGRALTATATAPSGSTSEFSPCDARRALGSVEFNSTRISAIEDVGALAIRVVRTGSFGTVTVNYASLDDTTTAGSDYLPAQGSVTFAPGETEKTITLNVLNDSVLEAAERLTLRLTSAGGLEALGARSTITVELLDNSAVPFLSALDARSPEGTGGATAVFVNVALSATSGKPVTFSYATADGTATAGADYVATSGAATIPPGSTAVSIPVSLVGDGANEPDETFFLNITSPVNATLGNAQARVLVVNDDSPRAQFSATGYTFSEAASAAVLSVTRSGDASAAVSFDVRTIDDTRAVRCDDTASAPTVAFARCDYATTVQTVTFAAGEASKTVNVPLVNDSHVEPDETVQIALSNPTNGAALGTPSTTVLTITSDDAPGASNPIISTDYSFFVRQQYLDFFGREPDAGGFAAWKGTLDACPDPFNTSPTSPSATCDRVSVSKNFFLSKEFALKGGFVFNFYKVAFGRLPRYSEIIPDMASLTAVDNAGFFAKKAQFTNSFVQRQEFKSLYDALSNSQFVDALMGPYNLASVTTVNPASPDDTSAPRVTLTRADLVSRLNGTGGTPLTRAQALRAIADSNEVSAAEANSSFVAMQYFGYLRRDPESGGYNDWLRTINANPNDSRSMVNGFMNSQEYRLRFGQP